MSSKQSYSNIGLTGNGVGTVYFKDSRVEWRDKNNALGKEILKENVSKASWATFGAKSYLKIVADDGETMGLDGFGKLDHEGIVSLLSTLYNVTVTAEKISSEGANYGEVDLEDRRLVMKSSISGYRVLDFPLDAMSLCVIPASNRDEVEIHFHDREKMDKEEDGLAQITLHFPMGADPEDDTPAEAFRKAVMDTGFIRSVTGDIIAEFSREQGNFVSPRGKYGVQMTSTYMHMQGAQYSYKIKYEDIHSLFLLPKPDGVRNAFVISLEKPIRQGNQKYSHLIWEAHKVDTTININLTDEEIQEKYDGQLTKEMTMPLSSLIAKIFKILSQTVVFVPKQFVSARQQSSVRCNLRANEGLLYPLAKSLIFINKPTILIKFDDIQLVEFLRYDAASNAATRNFDLMVTLNEDAKSESREYTFSAIDRSEYGSLFDFFNSRKLNVKIPETAKRSLAEAGSDEESDDDDYVGGEDSESSDDSGSGSGSGSGSDSDGSGSDGSGSEDEDAKHFDKGSKKRGRGTAKGGKAGKAGKGGEKKKRAKKDKEAPKGATTAFFYFSTATRPKVNEENPGMKITEVARELGVRWKALSAEERAPFEELAKQDKDRYRAEMVKYQEGKSAGATADDDSS